MPDHDKKMPYSTFLYPLNPLHLIKFKDVCANGRSRKHFIWFPRLPSFYSYLDIKTVNCLLSVSQKHVYRSSTFTNIHYKSNLFSRFV